MHTKYIVMKDEHGHELLFTFPETIAHNWMAHAVTDIREGVPANWTKPYRRAECIAAGFITADGVCWGKSESLGIASRTEADTLLWMRGSYK